MARTRTSTGSEASEPSDDHSRRSRLAAARRRHTRVGLVVFAILALAGAAGVAAYAMNEPSPQAQAVDTTRAAADPTFGAHGTIPAIGAQNLAERALDHAHPLRLWVGGDSLAGSFGPALGDLVGATGVAQTVVDYKVSSGLWSNDIRNWQQRATEQMTSANPEAVVFIIGTNDTPVVNKVDANGDGVPDWEAEYRAKVDRMMDELVGTAHRTVIWLGPPTLATKSMDAGAVEVGRVEREEAAKRAPDVVYVDTYKLFSGQRGGYSRTILDENGNPITARIGDGVHFTEDGAQYLARAIFAILDGRWHLTRQADRADPIGWTLASGSGENVPGLGQVARPRYNSSSSHWSPTTSWHSSGTTSPGYGQTATTSVSGATGVTSPATSPATTPATSPVTQPHITTPKTDPPSPPTTKK